MILLIYEMALIRDISDSGELKNWFLDMLKKKALISAFTA